MSDIIENARLATPPLASPGVRSVAIGGIGFLTLIDLFAAQAILPLLTSQFHASPAQTGLAVNASTLGMALAGPLTAAVASGIARRSGIWISLVALAAPTASLALTPDILSFGLLRVLQGVLMASAFTLTLAHFSERCRQHDMPRALAAYVTGSVMANLLGRLIASNAATHFGAPAAFLTLAALNLAGALLAYLTLTHVAPMALRAESKRLFEALGTHARNPPLLRAYATGFLILFAFVGLFTYVGFTLTAPGVVASDRTANLVFLCFLPSIATTPMAGRLITRHGTSKIAALALAASAAGAMMTAVGDVAMIFFGLALFSSGTFIAQAAVTSFVGKAARIERAAASGLYLSAYYLGGLAGAALVGLVYEKLGWSAVAIGVASTLILALVAAMHLREPTD
jgi:MFS transporter, YNFM family, putative membrane transport protein